ncbi:MAG TPA: ester cyclase [Solirubrobacteraceae bacterium]|jgi:glyoxylase-like metal-dependent hydrolase (beta-lactamase superfamily II)/predicted ester cyclase|nr:ester cyclase [Solirubrobacteraceae bacterium]
MSTRSVAKAYFEAIERRDVDAMVACWKPGGREFIRGQIDTTAPDGVRSFFSELFGAVPDFELKVQDMVVEKDRASVRWRATGTFCGESPFKGIEPNGARLELEGCDVLRISEDLIVANDAFSDSMAFARQIGMMPAEGSPAETRAFAMFNRASRVGARIAGDAPKEIAEGVWIVRGGFPARTMNVYLVRDGDGVLVFDGGIRSMTKAVAAAGARLGGITRLVLGHEHPDHRGIAPSLGVPVHCHPDGKADAEGDGGSHYFDWAKLRQPTRMLMPLMLKLWDGGPVPIAGTVSEGDDVAGFEVVHLPGHAPGQIGLWRASDRLALVSDCFYTLDINTGRPGPPRLPHRAFNQDTEQARASIRKLAALEPASAWPGHARPLTGDVRSQLEHAADTT